jgi:hypothetical protein
VYGDLSNAGMKFTDPLRPGDPGGVRIPPRRNNRGLRGTGSWRAPTTAQRHVERRPHMERKALWLFGGILALAVPAFAQTAAGDTIAALLVEVRQLRIAMERAATTTPQVQLLGAPERAERAARAGRARSRQPRSGSSTISPPRSAQTAVQADTLDNRVATETNPERQRQCPEQATRSPDRRADAREQRLRARESSWLAHARRSHNYGPSSIAASTRSSARSTPPSALNTVYSTQRTPRTQRAWSLNTSCYSIRNCSASAIASAPISSLAARSAIVRATLRTRS